MMTRTWVTFGLLVFAMPPAAGAQRVSEVQISPASVTIAVNQQTGVLATAYDANGNVLPTANFEWTSANPNVVRVETDPQAPGLANLVGLSPGITNVTATVGSERGDVQVQVLAVGGGGGGDQPQVGSGTPTVLRIEPSNIQLLPSESRQLVPVFLRDDGSLAAPTAITWQSLAAAVATVNDAGVATGISDGGGIIQLSNAAGLTARAPVEVTRADFGFTVPVLGLSPGAEATVQVVVPSQASRPLNNASITWRSTNDAVARVTPLGLVRALGPGEARIIASGFLQEDTLPVRVHRPVTDMSVLPGPSHGPVVVPFGGERVFEVEALAEDGTVVPDAPMVWTVADTTIARFDPDRVALEGLQIGSTELHLRGPGPDLLEATFQVEVVAGGLLIQPQAVGLGVGDTARLAASFTDTEGAPLSEATGVTWTSSDPAVAEVTSGGLVSAVGIGGVGVIASTPWDATDTMYVYVQGEIVFTSTRAGTHDLYAFDRSTPSDVRRITSDTTIETNAAWSPDGAYLAYVSNRGGNQNLWLVTADGSRTIQLTDTPDLSEDAPAWMPDGSRLVYNAQRPGERAQIWTANADGSDPRQLTTDSSTNFQPAVSPDGSTIAFTSTRDGSYDIWLMAADGSNQRNITQTTEKESRPEYLADGSVAYIHEQRQGGTLTQLVVRKVLATGEITPLTPGDLPVTDFAISPDGGLLIVQTTAFAAQGGIQHQLYLVPRTGGPPAAVPREEGEQQVAPAFRPAR